MTAVPVKIIQFSIIYISISELYCVEQTNLLALPYIEATGTLK